MQLRGGVSPAEGGAIVRAAGGEVTGALPIINGVAARLSPNAQKRLAARRADRARKCQRADIFDAHVEHPAAP